MHSTASDGTDPPAYLAQLAREAGLSAIALTDHDTTAGLQACAAACEQLDIQFAPGIEVSADPSAVVDVSIPDEDDPSGARAHPWGTLHILGLFVRHDAPSLITISNRMRAARDSRNPAIVARLQKLGLNIDYAEVQSLAKQQGTQIIGRPHIAQVLMEKGYVDDITDAFHRYIGQGRPAYERRDRLPAREAIDAIHQAGGVAVLAHPIQLKYPDLATLHRFVAQLRDWGLDAIEADHSDHLPAEVAAYQQLAADLGLVATAGSDYHGTRKPIAIGDRRGDMDIFLRLQNLAACYT